MPRLVRTFNQFMAEEKKDALFIKFYPTLPTRERFRSMGSDLRSNLDIDAVFAWLDAEGVQAETIMPPGLLAGNPGFFAIHFSSLKEDLYLRFLAAFETADGNSANPDLYQLYTYQYDFWLNNGGPEDLKREEEGF